MKKNLLILTIIFASALLTSAQALPASAKSFLKKNYAGWEISKFHKVEYQENKSTAKGDYDGDGKIDYVAVIYKDDRVYTLVLFANKNSYKAFNLLAQGDGQNWIAGVGTVSKGKKLDVFNDQGEKTKSFRLKTDAVYLYDGEGHGSTYYWQNGKFLMTRDF